MNEPAAMKDLGWLLQDFFCNRLIQQRRVSPHTVASYRDTFRLLLRFAVQRIGKTVAALCLADLDAPLVLAFLDHLEADRHSSVRSRNVRLAAIHSFTNYAAPEVPAALTQLQRVLAIPQKRFDRSVVGYLRRPEIEVLLGVPDPHTWSGRRDQALLMTLYNTGARVSEIVAVRRADVESERCAAVQLHGKGRKERVVPLWKRTAQLLRGWLPQIGSAPQQPLFPNRLGKAMTRSGVEKRLQAAVTAAKKRCPSLQGRNISPHLLRHTTAMHLLQSGVDLAVIALWLGHESVATTHGYLEADLQMKERALEKLQEPGTRTVRFTPSEGLLAFLDRL